MTWRSILFDWNSAAVLLLAVLPIVWGFFFLYRYRKERLEAFAAPPVLEAVMQERSPGVFWIKSGLFGIVWICGVLALMQPKGNERYIAPGGQASQVQKTLQKGVLRQKMHLVIFLLDASASMSIKDAYAGKTREAVAKDIVDDVISKLKGESVVLYAFTGTTMQIVPSTMDYLFTRLMLEQIQINEGETAGTNIESALVTAKKRYFTLKDETTKTIILLTDGGDTRLFGLEAQPLKDAIDGIVKPLSDAEEKHVRALVVGIGSQKGSYVPDVSYQGKSVLSSLELPLLRKLSVAGRGELWLANEMHPMAISAEISKAIARDTAYVDAAAEVPIPEAGEGTRVYDFYYQIPLGIALVALACCMLIPDTVRLKHGLAAARVGAEGT